MATHSDAHDDSVYYIPHNGWYPVFIALGVAMMLGGLGHWLNMIKAGEQPSHVLFLSGVLVLGVVLFFWFNKVIHENMPDDAACPACTSTRGTGPRHRPDRGGASGTCGAPRESWRGRPPRASSRAP